jgi:hypothetical protein
MKLHPLWFALLTLSGGLVCSLPARAETNWFLDSTGMADLGVDISKAGSTPPAHQKYLAAMSKADQSKIKTGCGIVYGDTSLHTDEVVQFCNDVKK